MKTKLFIVALMFCSVAYGANEIPTQGGNNNTWGTDLNNYLQRGQGYIDVRSYAVSGTGTTGDPWVDALRAAYAANGAGFHYHLPAGHYEDVTTIDVNGAGAIRITGDGEEVTFIHYATADATSAIKIHNNGVIATEISISDLSIDGDGTATGAGLEFEDVRNVVCKRMIIEGFDAGTSGIGIWLKGRDNMLFENIWFFQTPICFFVDNNPNINIDLDTVTFRNIFINPQDFDNGYGWKMTANSGMYNLIWDQIAIAKCLYGVYYKADTADTVIDTWDFRNMRLEQGDTVNKDSVAFHLEGDATYRLRQVLFQNVYFGDSYNSIEMIYGQGVLFNNCWFTGGAGYTNIDIDDNTISTTFINCFYNTDATDARPSDTELIYKLENTANGYIGMAVYDDPRSNWMLSYNGVAVLPKALANDATPSVGAFSNVTTGGTTTITDFDDGVTGQLLTVLCKHSLTFDFTSGQDADHNLDGSSADITADTGDILRFLSEDGTTWHLISNNDASADNN